MSTNGTKEPLPCLLILWATVLVRRRPFQDRILGHMLSLVSCKIHGRQPRKGGQAGLANLSSAQMTRGRKCEDLRRHDTDKMKHGSEYDARRQGSLRVRPNLAVLGKP